MASRGQRFVQVSWAPLAPRSAARQGSGGDRGSAAAGGGGWPQGLPPRRAWRPFVPLQIDGYDHAQGDVYFWAAQPNPVSAGTLLAVLPLVHRLRACVAISFSRDGRRWSRPLPLVACRAYGERGAHQPAAPAIIRRGDAVHIYINVDVPSIALDAFLPERDYRAIDARQPDGRLVRYTVPCRTLAAWTEEGLRSLRPSN